VRCDEVQTMIEEYYYGELEAERANRLSLHVAKCGACTKILKELETEDEVYHRYSEAVEGKIEVSPAIWNGVQRSILADPNEVEEQRVNRGLLGGFLSGLLPKDGIFRQAVFAVSLIILSIAGTVLTMKLLEEPGATRLEQIQFYTDQNSMNYAVLTIQRAEREYMSAIETLGDIVASLQPPMNAALRAELEQSLLIIDENISSMREAFFAHPSDPELAHYLLAAYNRKVELLQEFAVS